MDLCLTMCILMWPYELVMQCKLGACPKGYIICQADLWLKYSFNVSVDLMSIMRGRLVA